MRLALAQQAVRGADVGGNVDRAVGAVESAAADGADCVALPEVFNVGYFAFDDYARAAEPLGGPTHERVRAVAVEHDVAVLAGTIVEDLEASAAAGEASPNPTDWPTPPSSSTPTAGVDWSTGSTTSSATTRRRPRCSSPASRCRRRTSVITPSG